MQQKVQKWRSQHDDWKALAAFMLSKNTGRRFKKKKGTTSKDSAGGTKVKTVNKVHENKPNKSGSQRKGDNCAATELKISHRKVESNISTNDHSKISRIQSDANSEDEHMNSNESDSDVESVPERDENISVEGKIASRKGSSPDSCENKISKSSSKEMVIKKLNIEDLSSDGDIKVGARTSDKSIELFQSNSPVKKRKQKNAFFLDSNSEEDSENNADSGKDSSEESESEQEEESFFTKNKGK